MKKITTIIAAALTAVLFAGTLASCKSVEPEREAKPCEFDAGGLKITLTDAFKRQEMEGAAAFASDDVAVFVQDEKFSLSEGFGDHSVEEYGSMVMQSNGVTDTALTADGDLRHFTYDRRSEKLGADLTYTAFVFKGTDAFWLVQFANPKSRSEDLRGSILEWAGTVVIGDAK